MLMAKKAKQEDEGPIRPAIDGAIADAIRFDTRARGLRQHIDTIRLVLAEHYVKAGILKVGDDGELVFRKPSSHE